MFQTINRKCVQQLSQSTSRFNFFSVSIFLRSFCRLQNTVCLLTFCTKPSVTSSRSGMAADIVLNCSITLHFFLVNLTFLILSIKGGWRFCKPKKWKDENLQMKIERNVTDAKSWSGDTILDYTMDILMCHYCAVRSTHAATTSREL